MYATVHTVRVCIVYRVVVYSVVQAYIAYISCYIDLLGIYTARHMKVCITLLTLGAHARGLRYLSCVCVCVSVYPSVPALAASASVETSKQRYSRVSLRLFLD